MMKWKYSLLAAVLYGSVMFPSAAHAHDTNIVITDGDECTTEQNYLYAEWGQAVASGTVLMNGIPATNRSHDFTLVSAEQGIVSHECYTTPASYPYDPPNNYVGCWNGHPTFSYSAVSSTVQIQYTNYSDENCSTPVDGGYIWNGDGSHETQTYDYITEYPQNATTSVTYNTGGPVATSTVFMSFISWEYATGTGNGNTSTNAFTSLQTHIVTNGDHFPGCFLQPLTAIGTLFQAAANGTALKQVLIIHDGHGNNIPLDLSNPNVAPAVQTFATQAINYGMGFLWLLWCVWILRDLWHWFHEEKNNAAIKPV